MKLLHICRDEKYVNSAMSLFGKAFGENRFVIVLPPARPPIRYLDEKYDFQVFLENNSGFTSIMELTVNCDLVVIYGLGHFTSKIVEKCSHDRILWLILGADVYQNPSIYNQPLLGDQTKELWKKLRRRSFVLNSLRKVYHKLRYNLIHINEYSNQVISHVAGSIDFVGTFQREQFNLLVSKCVIPEHAIHLDFCFYPIDKISGIGLNETGSKIGVLIGNSASYTNNHIEIFNMIGRLEGYKVVVPLSYGRRNYAREIVKIGRDKFSDFHPMLDYIPLEEYNRVIADCQIVIMNHYRGQAAGNVLSALYRGCTLYLSNRNLILKYLKRIGCNVFSIEDQLEHDVVYGFPKLSPFEIEENRRILRGLMSEDVIVRNLQKGITEYMEHKEVSYQNTNNF